MRDIDIFGNFRNLVPKYLFKYSWNLANDTALDNTLSYQIKSRIFKATKINKT